LGEFLRLSRSEIAEIISAIAVVIGLVFVGMELRQNTLMQRVTATQTARRASLRGRSPKRTASEECGVEKPTAQQTFASLG
jgi:hypothetical protein